MDETEFRLYPKTTNTKNDIVWATTLDDVPPVGVEQYSETVRVCGGVSARGNTKLVFYEGELTAKKYLKILKDDIKLDLERILQEDGTFVHDGASAHKAKTVNSWLEENVSNYITSGPQGEWPAKSPDLNIIEHVWGDMVGKLNEHVPKDRAALKRKIQSVWKNLDQEYIEEMALKMKNRMKSLIRVQGDWTKD